MSCAFDRMAFDGVAFDVCGAGPAKPAGDYPTVEELLKIARARRDLLIQRLRQEDEEILFL